MLTSEKLQKLLYNKSTYKQNWCSISFYKELLIKDIYENYPYSTWDRKGNVESSTWTLKIQFLLSTDDKTEGYIGIPETLIVSAISGGVFALLSGQPIVIIGKLLLLVLLLSVGL